MKVYKATNTLDDYLPSEIYTNDKSQADILLVGGKKFDIKEFPKLSAIFKTGVGTDNLPFKDAENRNIRIVLPSHKTSRVIFEETANFTCHLILKGLYSNISNWEKWDKLERPMLGNRKLLIIGKGRIGSLVKKALSFLTVLSYDTLYNNYEELPKLIRDADCISLHLPLSSSTTSFIDEEKISWMKKGTLLVNTARGKLVCEHALYKALANSQIYALFDVFWNEPYSGKLMEFSPDRFITTPHIASTCSDFLKGCADDFLSLLNLG